MYGLNELPDGAVERCETSCLGADLVLLLHAIRLFDHLCVILTQLCPITILTTEIFDRYNEKTVESYRRLSIF